MVGDILEWSGSLAGSFDLMIPFDLSIVFVPETGGKTVKKHTQASIFNGDSLRVG